MCVGATLSLKGGQGNVKLMSWMIALRLMVAPVFAVLVGWALGLSLVERQILLLFSALPTASSAHVLAARMGGNGALVAVTMRSEEHRSELQSLMRISYADFCLINKNII